MSLVERLAAKAGDDPQWESHRKQLARWWLNAIAEEVLQANELWGDAVIQRDVAAWLRREASE